MYLQPIDLKLNFQPIMALYIYEVGTYSDIEEIIYFSYGRLV